MKNTLFLIISSLFILVCGTASADDDLWFGAKAGTLGLGLEATWRPLPYLDFRAGANGLSATTERSEAGVDYDVDLDLRTLFATVNLRMPMTPLRATAGLFANGNEFTLRSRDSSTFDIGGTTFDAAQVGSLNAVADFDGSAAYFGVGLDFRLADTVALNIDAGVLRQGTANVRLSADGPIASDPTFQAALATEQAELQSDLEDFDNYPVLSIGVSFNF